MTSPPSIPERINRHLRAAYTYGGDSLWEFALKEIDEAEDLCHDPDLTPEEKRLLHAEILFQRAGVERRQGHYERAKAILEEALERYGESNLDVNGELGVVLLRMDKPAEAQRHFGLMYEAGLGGLEDVEREIAGTREVGMGEEVERAEERERQMKGKWWLTGLVCRAEGYLGITSYQMAVPDLDDVTTVDLDKLKEAVGYCEKRVERARKLMGEVVAARKTMQDIVAANSRPCMVLDRLALCYSLLGETEKAVDCGKRSIAAGWDYAGIISYDPTMQALGRFYLGMALEKDGQHDEAMQQWQAFGAHDRCTSALALCKEPSKENIGFLKQLVKHGVKMDIHDEQGYSALDYAVMAKSDQMVDVVTQGLRKEFIDLQGLTEAEAEKRIEGRKIEAKRRREYRAIFQRSFRPCLRANALSDSRLIAENQESSEMAAKCIRQLRHEYVKVLDSDEGARSTFDRFKYISLSDFRANSKKLPRPDDKSDMEAVAKFIRTYNATTEGQEKEPYIVFVSYRWLLRGAPDDASHTQYHRINEATNLFLQRHPWLTPDQVGIWLDVGCIDQVDAEGKQRGINTLPLSIAQCNAMISLTDAGYVQRAWCSVEILIMQTLRDSYGLHEHWDYSLGQLEEPPVLLRGPTLKPVDDELTGLLLSYPDEDGPTVKFLLRQSRILAKV